MKTNNCYRNHKNCNSNFCEMDQKIQILLNEVKVLHYVARSSGPDHDAVTCGTCYIINKMEARS